MARISSYPRDLDVVDNDSWIGTESSNRQTKNYTAAAVAKYLNIKGKISISAQMVFKFEVNGATTGDFTGPADGAALNSIATMQLSIVDVSSQDVVAFMNYLVGNNILISKQNNISTFGHYTIDSYTDNGQFYTLNLTNLFGNGVFTQGVPATVWNIQHNLGKFPSVSVVNNNSVVLFTEVTYIDNNNVQLNFSAGFSGKAYLN
jgi:hypothetical protein